MAAARKSREEIDFVWRTRSRAVRAMSGIARFAVDEIRERQPADMRNHLYGRASLRSRVIEGHVSLGSLSEVGSERE